MKHPSPKFLLILACLLFALCTHAACAAPAPPVQASEDAQKILMDNGTLAVMIDKTHAVVNSIRYRHDGQDTEMCRALYFDSNGGATTVPLGMKAPRAGYEPLSEYVQTARLVRDTPDVAEAVLSGGPTPLLPFVTEIHYVLRRGESGLYAYAVYRHGADMSNEYINGGPVKQELTVHMGNTLLNMLEGGHFGGGGQELAQGEAWTKFYGPFLFYVNSAPSIDALWDDAKRQAAQEEQAWPYRWAAGPDYPVTRGTVTGRLKLTDSEPTQGAWVILAAPGGDWPMQAKGYEFWTRADANGRFTIPKVRPGTYALYAYGANQFEQFERDGVSVLPGKTRAVGALDWRPVTHGQTLWQIGTPDHSSEEFRDGDDVRHWANYLRYPEEFPDDVTFVIGKSHERTDWNYAQWSWYSKRPYWTIQFALPSVPSGQATLTLGFAASNPVGGNRTNLEVKINGTSVAVLHLPKSGAAAYRSGGQDSLYRVQYVRFDAGLLHAGANEITLGHQEAEPFPSPDVQRQGRVASVMYDALRLEVAPGK